MTKAKRDSLFCPNQEGMLRVLTFALWESQLLAFSIDCITLPAKSTAATYFTEAVKPDDSLPITVCWALFVAFFCEVLEG